MPKKEWAVPASYNDYEKNQDEKLEEQSQAIVPFNGHQVPASIADWANMTSWLYKKFKSKIESATGGQKILCTVKSGIMLKEFNNRKIKKA